MLKNIGEKEKLKNMGLNKNNKNVWFDMDSELHKEIKEFIEEKLGISFADFIRNSVYTTYLLFQQHGVDNVNIKLTSEYKLNRYIAKEVNK